MRTIQKLVFLLEKSNGKMSTTYVFDILLKRTCKRGKVWQTMTPLAFREDYLHEAKYSKQVRTIFS